MAQLRDLSRRFEDLCEQLFIEMGYQTEREARLTPQFRIDLVARKRSKIDFVVDIKLVLNSPGILSELRNICSRSSTLLYSQTSLPSRNLFLIVSCTIEIEHQSWLAKEFSINIWDRNKLLEEARKFPRVFGALSEFFDSLGPFENLGREQLRQRRDAAPPIGPETSDLTQLDEPTPPRGEELCQELHAIPPGKKGAKNFERIAVSIIDYLFGDFLLDARPQNRLEDRLSILDIIYRVKPGHPFWDTLTRDFRARVMIFECKNYTKPVQPEQIYTTERYVSAGALRPICFLMTRTKPHKHTELAAYGAMREGGKMFVFLDDDDICKMLAVRDAQLRLAKDDPAYFENDPTIVLDQTIYDFLGRMPR